MEIGGARYTAQQRLEFEEGGQRNLGILGEAHAGTALSLGHPFGDEDEAPIRRDAHEGAVAGRGPVRPRRRQRLAAEAMPRVVDGDRS